MKYRIGKTTFGSWIAKEHYVIEGHIRTLEWILKSTGPSIPASQRQFLQLTIRNLKAQEKRFRKQLIKDGYFTPEKSGPTNTKTYKAPAKLAV